MVGYLKTKYLIYGALGGFIATFFDKIFKEEVINFPLGSILFVAYASVVFLLEHLRLNETKGGSD